MSQPPKNNLPARRVNTARPAEKATPSASSESRPVSRSTTGTTRSAGPVRSAAGPSGGASRRPPARNVPERRDPFPYIMGAVIGALVMGLVLVVFLITSPKNTNTQGNNPAVSGGGATTLPNVGDTSGQVPISVSTAGNDATSVTSIEPTRMPISDFMKLYNDPANRPIIVDVRAKATYDEGHIAGAVNIPNEETDSRLNELPKDKLIVAYCQ